MPNYKTKTTSKQEYYFVADPSDEKLVALNIRVGHHTPPPTSSPAHLSSALSPSNRHPLTQAWPKELRDDLMQPKRSDSKKEVKLPLLEGEVEKVEDRRRKPAPLSDYTEEGVSEKNEKLRDLGMDPLQVSSSSTRHPQ